jgi:hypothetical protein
MVDCRGAQHESRNVRGYLLPTVMLDNFASVSRVLVFRVVWRPLLVENQLCVGNPGGPDFEGLAGELALSVDLCDDTHQQNATAIS